MAALKCLKKFQTPPHQWQQAVPRQGLLKNHAVILLQTSHFELQGTFQRESLEIYILLQCQDIQKI